MTIQKSDQNPSSATASKAWTKEQEQALKMLGGDLNWDTIAGIAGHTPEECKRHYTKLLQESAEPTRPPASSSPVPTPAPAPLTDEECKRLYAKFLQEYAHPKEPPVSSPPDPTPAHDPSTAPPEPAAPPTPTWTSEQDSFIQANAGKADWAALGAIMGRSSTEVASRWCELQATLAPPPPSLFHVAPPPNMVYAGQGTYHQPPPTGLPPYPAQPPVSTVYPPGSIIVLPVSIPTHVPATTTPTPPVQVPPPPSSLPTPPAPLPPSPGSVPAPRYPKGRAFPSTPPEGMSPSEYRRQDAIALFYEWVERDRIKLPPPKLKPDWLWEEHDCRVLEVMVAREYMGGEEQLRRVLYTFTDRLFSEGEVRRKVGELAERGEEGEGEGEA